MLLIPGTLSTLECAIGLIVGGALQVTVVTVTVTLTAHTAESFWLPMYPG